MTGGPTTIDQYFSTIFYVEGDMKKVEYRKQGMHAHANMPIHQIFYISLYRESRSLLG